MLLPSICATKPVTENKPASEVKPAAEKTEQPKVTQQTPTPVPAPKAPPQTTQQPKAEEKKDGPITGAATAGTLPEEKELFGRLQQVSAATEKAITDEDFEQAMRHLATLRPAIDAFFDKVKVNCEDRGERLNRLRLLAQIRSTMNRVADFSKIEG